MLELAAGFDRLIRRLVPEQPFVHGNTSAGNGFIRVVLLDGATSLAA
jgi:hypothetical protein